MIEILDAGFWILDAGFWILDVRCWMLDRGGVDLLRCVFPGIFGVELCDGGSENSYCCYLAIVL